VAVYLVAARQYADHSGPINPEFGQVLRTLYAVTINTRRICSQYVCCILPGSRFRKRGAVLQIKACKDSKEGKVVSTQGKKMSEVTNLYIDGKDNLRVFALLETSMDKAAVYELAPAL